MIITTLMKVRRKLGLQPRHSSWSSRHAGNGNHGRNLISPLSRTGITPLSSSPSSTTILGNKSSFCWHAAATRLMCCVCVCEQACHAKKSSSYSPSPFSTPTRKEEGKKLQVFLGGVHFSTSERLVWMSK